MRGYDHLNINSGILLDLRMQEETGTNTQDWAKPHHLCTLNGVPVWTNLANDLSSLEFDPSNPDYVISLAAATGDLNFTVGGFSGMAWIYPHALGNRNIFARGVASTDGWSLWLDTNGRMVFSTYQAAGQQFTYGTAADVAINGWVLVGFSRAGASARIYTNGVDTTGTAVAHTNPLTANRNLYIGVNDLAGAGWYDGSIYRPRLWGRTLAPDEFLQVFQMERDILGV